MLFRSLLVASFVAFALGQNITQVILDALESALDCTGCHALLIPLQTLAHLGNDDFVSVITSICTTLGLEDADGPILAHSLRDMSATGATATKFCTAVFGLCDPPAVNAFTVPLAAPPATPKVWKSTGRTPFQVAHFSDVGAEANCSKSICCRNYADEAGDPITQPAGPFGEFTCDAPPALAASMLTAIGGVRAQFALFTGDVEEGDVWLTTEDEVTTDLVDWNSQMAAALNIPVFPVIGNHDTSPVNSFPRNTTDTTFAVPWVFNTQGAGWQQWIGAAAAAQEESNSGSYAVVVPGQNLRFWLYDSDALQPDPNGILAFLAAQLQIAETAGDRAWIIGHMPLGKSDALHDQSNYYNQIIQRYSNTIAAQFFGHSHKDEFEIGYSDYTHQSAATANQFAWICPSLTPTSGNPAFKVYDIDPDTFEVMDMHVHIANLTAPTFQTNPVWEVYYSARDTYGALVGAPTATQVTQCQRFGISVTEAFASNTTAFQEYNTRISRGGMVAACDAACQTTAICDMRALRSENNCPGFQFQEAGLGRGRDECSGSLFGPLFSQLLGAKLT
ncbi:sphingomyelin phosphodiesterase [Roridomyces roridus]|uniref:Sphingomyelin phosphodiesterase n=1 Tax=Roridomyces roridus TaxID=1738132 RepID=A0AAD7CEF2_9AGAR|nr:sphingomyelin phosphodiesterase [Roridomyces roridus]